MINIALTDEQARWLREHLNVLIVNAHCKKDLHVEMR